MQVAYESLGFVFATGKVAGRKLEVVQLRIGGPRDDARKVIGYAPDDDSQVNFAQRIAEIAAG